MVTSLWSEHHSKRSSLNLKAKSSHPPGFDHCAVLGETSRNRDYSCSTWDMHKLKELTMTYAGRAGDWASVANNYWFITDPRVEPEECRMPPVDQPTL